MQEGIPNQEPGIDFDPNKDYVADATGEGVESQESQEIQAETVKLQEQLEESKALFTELKDIPEEGLQSEGVSEKVGVLYTQLQKYKKLMLELNVPGMGAMAGTLGILSGAMVGLIFAFENAPHSIHPAIALGAGAVGGAVAGGVVAVGGSLAFGFALAVALETIFEAGEIVEKVIERVKKHKVA